MAARFKPKLYTLGASAVNLSTILGSPNDDYVSNVVLRAAKANVGDLYWGDGSELGGYLEPREAVSIDLSGKFVAIKDLYLSGTTGDQVYITVVG